MDDAFGAAHRAHASIEGITHHVEGGGRRPLSSRGELAALGRIFEQARASGLGRLLGGAKVSDKLALVEQPARARSTASLIGGGMAFTFLAALGPRHRALARRSPTGSDAARAILERARSAGIPLRLPVDVVAAAGLDGNRPGFAPWASARFPAI